MQAVFHEIVMQLALSGLVAMLVVIPVCAASRRLRTQFHTLNAWNFALATLFLFVAVRVGGMKTNNVNTTPPQQLMMPRPTLRSLSVLPPVRRGGVNLADPVQAGRAAAFAADWNVCGAWKDSFWLPFADGWVFPWGTNHLSGVEVVSYGRLWMTPFDTNAVASAGAPFEILPGLTSFSYELTPSNSYRFAWINAAIGRDTNDLVTAVLELCRNGDVAVTTNGVTAYLPRTLPFAHDGYGQNAEWVVANFTRFQEFSPSLTNAEELLSVGYANWVDAQVGVGQQNGLYKFTASFEDAPPEPTQLYIGDYSVCVTNAGDYVFLLEKGTDYEFGTWPYIDSVDYYAQDDMSEDAPMLMSWWGDGESPGEWSVDGGDRWLWRPQWMDWGYQEGYCCMMPTLQGSPAVTHLGPEDFPMTFDSVLSDITQDCEVEYEWIADTECFDIASPHSRSTQITAKSVPRWNETTLSVSARFKNKSLTSMTTPFTYGTNATPSVSIALEYPSVTFLNDDKRSDRIYRLSAIINSDSCTNGIFTVLHSGDDNPLISTSTNFVNTNRSFTYRFNLNKNCLTITNHFYVMSRDVRHGAFSLSCTLADGTTLSSRRDYKVIEPLCKLITTQKGQDGRYLNPSRLVYGTNAWLQVGVRGDFPSSQIQWSITPDTCRYLQSCDYGIKIEPTVTSGVAVVKAKFNDDPHQPTFTLPIVMPRIIPVKAFIVNDADGNMATTVARVRRQISTANEIFEQVGIKFDLEFTGRVLSTNFHTLAEHDIALAGSTNSTVSAQAISLFNVYTNRNCIEIYYVSRITNSLAAAFSCSKGIVMSAKGSDYSLAHELGHMLGAMDCYAKAVESDSVTKWFATILPRRNYFGSAVRDWGDAEGRGFYEKSDRYYTILSKCLMNGLDGYHQADIPDGAILSLKKNARSNADVERSPVGATIFEGKRNEEVYSQ